ncbi:sugar ABC transporter ATP-binding protein [Prosthecomicrobium pneumaticum]|uniref:Ribose transport system ATP-binding protein n=1 Tax=Prosthecomicrobium pneumaticum TaxID=81895 RepID=A0A7W9CVR7_9HYPH|nr:sugar ABC transporter ATP-binding protein [Prosthecomicrobium pneumaticum]MBB5752559.1 ribose transport system ATP-binding protein [Prosthecomicrobium pneumaticum]
MSDVPSAIGRVAEPGAPRALPVLDVADIAKTFGGAKALRGVSFSVAPGEVHGLLGKNGSGKSTLVKILAGFHAPDHGGRLAFNGEMVDLPLKPGDFRRLGMSFVHQNLGLVPSLTVLENLRFAHLTTARSGYIDWRAERAAAREALGRFGLSIDTAERVDRLSPVERALLAIVRAFEEIRVACAATGKPGLVLLDEPTPFLPREGVEKLFGLIRSIAATGSSVIFISHDIDEVMTITDRITVLRDGALAGALETAKATHEEVVEMIVGRRIARLGTPGHQAAVAKPAFLRVSGVAGGALAATDLVVGKGEILGVTGLIGSGYEELPYLIFGARPCRAGALDFVDGAHVPLAAMSPKRALDLGLALLPGDRQGASGVDSLPIVDNMFLPDVDRFFRFGLLNRRAMVREAFALGTRYEVRPNDPAMKLSALSGGNAQKVLIARWMNRNPRLLLLDEPTQGVDVGTRVQIFAALRAAAAAGMSVLCASSDAEQLAEICDRVLIFARGRVCAEITGPDLTKDGIAEACYASIDLTGRTAPAAPALAS